jgi:hypothetical protein
MEIHRNQMKLHESAIELTRREMRMRNKMFLINFPVEDILVTLKMIKMKERGKSQPR